MGSTHGTFLSSHPGAELSLEERVFERLSAPKTASLPRRLGHQDALTVGSTTFLVHIHDNRQPCSSCCSTNDNEIPLLDGKVVSSKSQQKTSVTEALSTPATGPVQVQPRRALQTLKEALLSRHSDAASTEPSTPSARSNYIDRSARRRALHPHSHEDLRRSSPRVEGALPMRKTASAQVTPAPSESAPATPPPALPSSNIGHRLLEKQGWEPGTALGDKARFEDGVADDVGRALIEPLDVKANEGRAGLGASIRRTTTLSPSNDWKDSGRRRRWEEAFQQ